MKIIKLEVEGYRSLKTQTWTPGDLNVLIGPNASGKSNLLRSLELLSTSAGGGLGKFIQREGGIQAVLWDGQSKQVHLNLTMTPPDSDPKADSLSYELILSKLGQTRAFQIDYEALASYGSEAFMLLERVPHHAAIYSKQSDDTVSIETSSTTVTTTTIDTTQLTPLRVGQPIEASGASFRDDESLLSYAAGPFAANRIVADVQEGLATWRIHQALRTDRDSQMRVAQVARQETQVSDDGQNLISVLHSLYTSDRDFKNEVNEAMLAAFGDDFEELVFPPAADQRIQMRIRWRSLKREQSAADLSDGTLRFLFLLAVFANPKPPPLIAIDEPETGLHPSMLPIVAEYAREASRRSQVVLSTHSPEFLDAFGDQPPTTTVVERSEGQTLLRVVSGEELSYWLKQYSLGELYRSKELEAMQ